MNCYALVEGRRTEKMLMRAWFTFLFPGMVEVEAIDLVINDNFFILSGAGYPQYLARIPEVLDDAARHGNIDNVILWVDTEGQGYEDKVAELQLLAESVPFYGRKHIVLANCCIETWLLGNKKMLRKVPNSQRLKDFKAFYDVSLDDPEAMGDHPDYGSRADFHFEYLRDMHRERGLSYTKTHPGTCQDKHYFDALVDRVHKTGHIPSFQSLLTCLKNMGSEYIKL
jgi:hypothetical protein